MTGTTAGLRSRPPAQRAGIVLGVLLLVLAVVAVLNRPTDRSATSPSAASASRPTTPVATQPDGCGEAVALAEVDAPPVTVTLGVTVIAGPRLQAVDASGGEPRASSSLLPPEEAASSAVRTAAGVYAVTSACAAPHTVLLAGGAASPVDSSTYPALLVDAGDRALRVTTVGTGTAVDRLDGSQPVPLPTGFVVSNAVGGLLVGRLQFVPTANDAGNGAGKAPSGPTDETTVRLVDPATGGAAGDLGTTSSPVLVSDPLVFWAGPECQAASGTCRLSWWDATDQSTTTRTCPILNAGQFTGIHAVSPDRRTLALESPVDPDRISYRDGSTRTRLSLLDTQTCTSVVVDGLGLTTAVPVAMSFDPTGTLLVLGVPVDGGYDVLAWRAGWASVRRLVTLSGLAAATAPLLVGTG